MHNNSLVFKLSSELADVAWEAAQAANTAHTYLQQEEERFAQLLDQDTAKYKSLMAELADVTLQAAEVKVEIARVNFNCLLEMAGVVTQLPYHPNKRENIEGTNSTEIGFGEWLGEQVAHTGVTQRQIAAKAGVSESYLSGLKQGKRGTPSQKVMISIAKALAEISGIDESGLVDEVYKSFGPTRYP